MTEDPRLEAIIQAVTWSDPSHGLTPRFKALEFQAMLDAAIGGPYRPAQQPREITPDERQTILGDIRLCQHGTIASICKICNSAQPVGADPLDVIVDRAVEIYFTKSDGAREGVKRVLAFAARQPRVDLKMTEDRAYPADEIIEAMKEKFNSTRWDGASVDASWRAAALVFARMSRVPTEGQQKAGFLANKFENKQPDGTYGCPGVNCPVEAPKDWLDPTNVAAVRAYMDAPKCLIARVTIPADKPWAAMTDVRIAEIEGKE